MEALQLQKYDEWLAEHLDELVTKYPGKVVAIHEDEVVIVSDHESEVYRQIRERGLEPMPLVFRVPREEDLQSILRSDS
ncbi:MAG TPA: hypothetical protein EYP19_16210 [Desulfobacterales bacterium]|nr:hypothetical protein [Desulfobacterales bacterium]